MIDKTYESPVVFVPRSVLKSEASEVFYIPDLLPWRTTDLLISHAHSTWMVPGTFHEK